MENHSMKCVLTVAGLGTRLLPLTKEIPKEMMPVYARTKDGSLILKPMLQVIYESLYEYGVRDFCFVVGSSKKSVIRHFMPESKLIRLLKKEKKVKLSIILEDFFRKLKRSRIIFAFQPKPIGFGNAIYHGRKFVGRNNFLLHAGDDIVISRNNDHLRRLESAFNKYHADIAFLVESVKDPSQYGVVNGPILEKGVIDVKEMVEKPKKPRSKNAIIAVYLFKPIIFKYLLEAKKSSPPEERLAEAFNIAIRKGNRVIGVLLRDNEKRVDIGTPETYARVLSSLG